MLFSFLLLIRVQVTGSRASAVDPDTPHPDHFHQLLTGGYQDVPKSAEI